MGASCHKKNLKKLLVFRKQYRLSIVAKSVIVKLISNKNANQLYLQVLIFHYKVLSG